MIREDKEKVVVELNKLFSEAKGVYLTDFTGINVETINKLRRHFRKENIDYRIVKNTLTRLAIKGLPLDQLQPYLTGCTGLVMSFEDALLPGKVIEDFQKKTDLLPIKAAVIDGTVYNRAETEKIIKLPPREVLIAKMLGSLMSPLSGIVIILNGILRNLVGVIDAVRVQKEKAGSDVKIKEQPEHEAGSLLESKKEKAPDEAINPEIA